MDFLINYALCKHEYVFHIIFLSIFEIQLFCELFIENWDSIKENNWVYLLIQIRYLSFEETLPVSAASTLGSKEVGRESTLVEETLPVSAASTWASEEVGRESTIAEETLPVSAASTWGSEEVGRESTIAEGLRHVMDPVTSLSNSLIRALYIIYELNC